MARPLDQSRAPSVARSVAKWTCWPPLLLYLNALLLLVLAQNGRQQNITTNSPRPDYPERRDYLKMHAFDGKICGIPQSPVLFYNNKEEEEEEREEEGKPQHGYKSIRTPHVNSMSNVSKDSLGINANPGEFPWFVRLELGFKEPIQVQGANSSITQPPPPKHLIERYCGATLIHPIYLLTSASCFHRAGGLGVAVQGTAVAGRWTFTERDTYWQRSKITATCSMANFKQQRRRGSRLKTATTMSNHHELDLTIDEERLQQPQKKREDVLLVELAKPFKYTQRVQPCCLSDPLSSLDLLPIETAAMAGFGNSDDVQRLPVSYLKRLLMRPCYDQETAGAGVIDQICMMPLNAREGNPCEGDQGNGIFVSIQRAWDPLQRKMLRGILSAPASSCLNREPPGKPSYFSYLSQLNHELHFLLAGCTGRFEMRRKRHSKARNHHHRKTTTTTIEHITI